MIKISVDEAEAMDRLAILYVKRKAGLDVCDDQYRLEREIQHQTASVTRCECTEEFKALLAANHEVFQLIERAKKDEVKASEVQAANRRRYEAKKHLQEKFFSTPLTEVKS